MSIELSPLNKISNQDIVYGIYYCSYKELKKTKYNDKFISIGLSDSSGSLDSKIWNNCDFYDSKFNEGDIIAVKGFPNLYRNKIELNIANILKCNPLMYEKYGFSLDMIISKVDFDVRVIWREIARYFKKTGIKSPLIKKIYYDYKKSILTYPSNMEPALQTEGTFATDLHKALELVNVLLSEMSERDDFNSDLIYSLIFLIKFDLITGYKKDIVYSLKKESSNRGLQTVFSDIIKKYKNTIEEKSFFNLEKSIFDSKSDEFEFEKKIVEKVYSLISYVN